MIFFRELERYSELDLKKGIQWDLEKTRELIGRLLKDNVLKYVGKGQNPDPGEDETDDRIEVEDDDVGKGTYDYAFTFVGVLYYEGIIICVYPKYMNDEPDTKKFVQILDVLRKANKKRLDIHEYDSEEETDKNLLALKLFLIDDYLENGLYLNEEVITELNGSGEILWDKTVNELTAYLNNDNSPVYLDFFTRKRVSDDFDFFRRLHAAVLSEITEGLKNSGLLDLFGLNEVYLTEDRPKDIGDADFLEYKLNGELGVQFNTRKQALLKVMRSYIKEKGAEADGKYLSIYGTTHFNTVWEAVCQEVFEHNESLAEMAKQPTWFIKEQWDAGLITEHSWNSARLKPDYVAIKNDKNGNKALVVLDAKYYRMIINSTKEGIKKIEHYPGVESIAKQYLYQLSYVDYMQDKDIDFAANAFLFPYDCNDSAIKGVNRGRVALQILKRLTNLQDIQLIYLNAEELYALYLNNKHVNCIEEYGIDIKLFAPTESVKRLSQDGGIMQMPSERVVEEKAAQSFNKYLPNGQNYSQ